MMIIKPLSITTIALALLACNSSNTSDYNPATPITDINYQSRINHGARLETSDKIHHCAGQANQNAFNNYYNQMPEDKKPNMYMDYFSLENMYNGAMDELRDYLQAYRDNGVYILPHIAISMTNDAAGNENANYEGDVGNGEYDAQIDILIEELKKLNHPIYLRIGYEANGWTWNEYKPDTYVQAFRRITDRINTAGLRDNVATVWHLVAQEDSGENPNAMMSYYPGDAYVDWFALSYFYFAGHLSELDSVNRFMEQAAQANKPVMLAEATPTSFGTDDGVSDWNNWFTQYFSFIQDNPSIKATCYINWDWTDLSYSRQEWAFWGDARIEGNADVRDLYIEQINQTIYQHAVSETDYWNNVRGSTDQSPPNAITDLNITSSANSAILSWSSVEDDVAVIRYDIFVDDVNLDSTIDTQIEVPAFGLSLGTNVTLTVVAVDRSGNQSEISNAVVYSVPAQAETIINGDFEANIDAWNIQDYGQGSIRSKHETTAPITGNGSASIAIDQAGNTHWHLQFEQTFDVKAGRQYDLSYTVQSDIGTDITVMIQEAGSSSPYTLHDQGSTLRSNIPQTVTDSFSPTQDDKVALRFMLGDMPMNAKLVIDDVTLMVSE